MIFLDTCILIDYLRETIEITEEDKRRYCINSIVQMEIIMGARDKRELIKINRQLSKFYIVDISQEILTLATMLTNKYVLSHNMTMYDAIIAATCMVYDLPLWTYNKRDFRYLNELDLVDAK